VAYFELKSSPSSLIIASFSDSPNPIVNGSQVKWTVDVTGGKPPYAFRYAGLPQGCASGNSATLSCTPALAGYYTIAVTVSDSASHSASGTAALTVKPVAGITVSSFQPTSSSITNGTTVTFSVSASGGIAPYTYTYTGLPQGCSSSNTSTLSCTPAFSGSYTVAVMVSDRAGHSTTGTTSLTVNPATGEEVVDDAGRTVTVPSTPQRIVVLIPSATDIVIRLGLHAKIVGIDCTPSAGGLSGDYTPGQIANWSLSGIPCVTVYPSLDITGIIALAPDLVIGGSENGVANLNTLTNQDHIPTLYLSPNTLLGIAYDVQITAQLTGTTAMGTQVNQAMSAALNADQTLLQNATKVPKVLLTYYVDSGGYWTYGTGTFGNDLLELSGAVSISANISSQYPEISTSYALAANPDAIVVGIGFGLNESYYATYGPQWSSFQAVSLGHVFAIDVTLLTEPDPSMVLGLSSTILALHPELSGGTPL
jgi:ABC-type Fe3+-hydroxamate transport system substrate-binding protein